jgi:membrane protease YdiL (CAAX protease family)
MELSPTRGQVTSPSKRLVQLLRRYPLLSYFLIAFAFSWAYELIVWGILHAPTGLPWGALLNLVMTLVGPALAAFLMTAVTQGRVGIVQLLRRFVLWRVGIAWYLLVLPGVLVLMLLPYLFLPGAFSAFRLSALSSPGFWLPFLIVYVVVFIAGGPLGEEPGWRGFALPRLQQRAGPLVGTLLLGVLWSLWHLPLYLFIPGYNGAGTGLLGILGPFVEFVIMVMAMAYVFTWVFNNTCGSLLLAILLHASINTASIMLPYLFRSLPQTGSLLFGLSQSLVWVVLAVLIIAVTRGRLSYCSAG